MTKSEQLIKDLESNLSAVAGKFKQDMGQIRGNRPSAELVQDIKVSLYDQSLSIRELGSLTVLPPRGLQITVWDENAIGAVMNAITNAHLGLSASNDGNTIRATLSPLGDERREELMKLVKKTAEGARIQVRTKREEAMKRMKDAETKKEVTEDDVFKTKDKIQKLVDKANKDIESVVEAKLKELGE